MFFWSSVFDQMVKHSILLVGRWSTVFDQMVNTVKVPARLAGPAAARPPSGALHARPARPPSRRSSCTLITMSK
jgi:hypothetical protein